MFFPLLPEAAILTMPNRSNGNDRKPTKVDAAYLWQWNGARQTKIADFIGHEPLAGTNEHACPLQAE
jgi:hypothetical protein